MRNTRHILSFPATACWRGRYKASLKEARAGDKDRDAGARKETERLQAENKALVRQRGELLGAFRKQMKLIDVLKRQKVTPVATHGQLTLLARRRFSRPFLTLYLLEVFGK